MMYERLMSFNPTVYDRMINTQGQIIEFVEHPTQGDEHPVIAVCHELKLAASTGFFELDDMLASHGEYEPWFTSDGELEIGY
jgi:hypothetical protein